MDKGLWLITSGAFVDQELSAEFGRLPPSFLPVGTKRLYEHQIESLGKNIPIYIMVPESYNIIQEDMGRLADAAITVLPIPDGMSLGDAVVFALNLIGGPDQPVRILHGDTLIADLPTGLDELGVVVSEEEYSWGEVQVKGHDVVGLQTFAAGEPSSQKRIIACGYFSFSRSTALVRGISRKRGDFLQGILSYSLEQQIKAVEIETEKWLDFGHLQTFFRSRRFLASTRSFNTLRIDGRVVRKLSTDSAKMKAEAAWFSELPPSLRVYTARLIDSGEDNGLAFYETEYEHLPTLSELFVFGTLARPSWIRILQSCTEFLTKCVSERGEGDGNSPLLLLSTTKTRERLKRFSDDTGFNVNQMLRYDGRPLPSLMQIAEDIISCVDSGSSRCQSVMHGDFCFSNILYNSRVQRIRVIDPRGYVGSGERSIMGDVRYDIAKLTHSIIGRYDQIIAGRYSMASDDNGRFAITFENSPNHSWLEDAWRRSEIDGVMVGSVEIQAITIGLFLSMLPLHADRPDRQRAFIANALRLYIGLQVPQG